MSQNGRKMAKIMHSAAKNFDWVRSNARYYQLIIYNKNFIANLEFTLFFALSRIFNSTGSNYNTVGWADANSTLYTREVSLHYYTEIGNSF